MKLHDVKQEYPELVWIKTGQPCSPTCRFKTEIENEPSSRYYISGGSHHACLYNTLGNDAVYCECDCTFNQNSNSRWFHYVAKPCRDEDTDAVFCLHCFVEKQCPALP